MPNVNLIVCDERSLDPELVAALKKAHDESDIYRLFYEYGQDMVVDAILLCKDDCHPESYWNRFSMKDCEELTKEAFEDQVLPDIIRLFLDRKRMRKQDRLTLDDVLMEE